MVSFGDQRVVAFMVVGYGRQRIECYAPEELLPVRFSRHGPSGQLARKTRVGSCVCVLGKRFIGLEDSSGANHAMFEYPSLRDRTVEAFDEKDVLTLNVRDFVHGNFDTAYLRQVEHSCFNAHLIEPVAVTIQLSQPYRSVLNSSELGPCAAGARTRPKHHRDLLLRARQGFVRVELLNGIQIDRVLDRIPMHERFFLDRLGRSPSEGQRTHSVRSGQPETIEERLKLTPVELCCNMSAPVIRDGVAENSEEPLVQSGSEQLLFEWQCYGIQWQSGRVGQIGPAVDELPHRRRCGCVQIKSTRDSGM